MASREFWEEQFEAGANSPPGWRWSAHDLIAAANIVRRSIEAGDSEQRARWTGRTEVVVTSAHRPVAPAMMLYAFAVESLTKAVLIACGTKATEGMRLAKALNTHDLVALVKETGLSIDNETNQLLQRMSRFIASGRYPVLTRPHPVEFGDGIVIPQDFDCALALLQRLDDTLCLAAPGEGIPARNVREL
jgi:hypothetical protein